MPYTTSLPAHLPKPARAYLRQVPRPMASARLMMASHLNGD